jgi:hypothetical protein
MLSLVQSVRGELGLSVPNAVASSTDQDILTTLALMNAAGQELVNLKAGPSPWNALNIEYRFNTQFHVLTGTLTSGSATVTGISSTAGIDSTYMPLGVGIPQDTYIQSVDSATQVTLTQPVTASGAESLTFCKTQYTLPSDYKAMISRTAWDKSKRWEMLGAEDAQQWQWIKSGYIATGVRIRYRILNNLFQIWPPTSTSELLGYEYTSNGWAVGAAGARQTKFILDSDTSIYKDRLLIIFTKLKYFELKGFDTTAHYRDFNQHLAIEIAQDTVPTTLSFAPKPSEVLIGYNNIPDSNYGT